MAHGVVYQVFMLPKILYFSSIIIYKNYTGWFGSIDRSSNFPEPGWKSFNTIFLWIWRNRGKYAFPLLAFVVVVVLIIVSPCIGMIYNYRMWWNVFMVWAEYPTLIHPNEWNLSVRHRGSSNHNIFVMVWVDSNHLPPELQVSTHLLQIYPTFTSFVLGLSVFNASWLVAQEEGGGSPIIYFLLYQKEWIRCLLY